MGEMDDRRTEGVHKFRAHETGLTSEVCQWILNAWEKVKTSTIINGFVKAGILETDIQEESCEVF